MRGPRKESRSIALPTFISLVLETKASTNFCLILLSKYTLEAALHFCPLYPNAAFEIPAAALSISALAVTITGFLPPSSAIKGRGSILLN